MYIDPVMANQPDINKRILSIQVRRELYAKLSKLAKRFSLPLSVVCRRALETATEDVELTPEDYDQIKRDIEQARKG